MAQVKKTVLTGVVTKYPLAPLFWDEDALWRGSTTSFTASRSSSWGTVRRRYSISKAPSTVSHATGRLDLSIPALDCGVSR